MWFFRLPLRFLDLFDSNRCVLGWLRSLLRKLWRLNDVVHHLVVELLEVVVPEAFAGLGGGNRPKERRRNFVVAELIHVILQVLYDFFTAQLHIVVNVASLFFLELNAAVATRRFPKLLEVDLGHRFLFAATRILTDK